MTESTSQAGERAATGCAIGCFAAFFGFFLLTGLVVMFLAGRGIAEGIAAERWPRAEGTLLKADEELETRTESGGRSGRSRTVTTGRVEVAYTYRVGGREYRGTRVHPAYWRSSFLASHAGVDSLLEAGQRVQVRYRPGSPERSTLAAGFYSSTLALLFAGMCFVVFGAAPLAAAYYNAVRGDRRRSKLILHATWMGIVLTLALAGYFSERGNQDFAAGITILR